MTRPLVDFGTAPDGSPVSAIPLHGGALRAQVLTWGASLQDLRLDGIDHPLVLGAPDLAAYLGKMRYYGAIVGPVANRIAGGRFTLDGARHDLDRNEAGRTTLHGGTQGFGSRNWRIGARGEDAVTLHLDHPHGLGGFPGALAVSVTYALRDQSLIVTIAATTDRATVFSPAFHGYWNLDGRPTLDRHLLEVAATRYLATDADLIPVAGPPAPVAGTPFDHRTPAPVTGVLDHNFCLDPARDPAAPVCRLHTADLALRVTTEQPGLQVYDAGRNDTAPARGLTGQPYGNLSGLAIEPQFWPDTPNRPDFPQNRLDPGAPYRQVTGFHLDRLR